MKTIWIAFIALGISATGIAGEFGCQRCASCGGSCVLQMRPTTTTETCYDVECHEICIPAVRFPWDCGPARCGRTRLVTRLTSQERDKPDCEYEWVNVCDRCGRPQKDSKPAELPPAPAPPQTTKTSGAIWLIGNGGQSPR